MKKVNLIEEYKKSASVANRYVSVALIEGDTDIECHYFPNTKELKLIFPDRNEALEITVEESFSHMFETLPEDKKYDYLNAYLEDFIEEKELTNGNFVDDERDFLTNGFINVPQRFLFNNQETTDNIVITKNNNGKYGMILIDRGLPPTGWAMAGGMVEENETALENSDKELEEELGSEMTSKRLMELENKIETYEVRGSINTLVSIFYSKDGYAKALAGDDAADSIFISMEDLQEILTKGKKTIKGKEVKLVPHHANILEKVVELSATEEKLQVFFKEVGRGRPPAR